MKTLVKEINTSADGVIELFSVVNNYIANSVIIFEIQPDNTAKYITPIELGNNFIQITPAPAGTLVILYEWNNPNVVDVNSIIPGLAPWDSKKVIKLIEIVQTLQDSVNRMEEYLKERLSKTEFNAWSCNIETRLTDLQSLI